MLQTTCKLPLNGKLTVVTLAVTTSPLFTVLFSTVNFTGVSEPNMVFDPVAETSISSVLSVKLVKTLTSAMSA
jgi:hypothetical protein